MKERIVHSADFNRRPARVRWINGLLSLGPSGKLSKDKLIWLARKRTGLHDFGAGYWEEPLEILLQAIEEEARLSPLGRFMIREQLVGRLEVRLRAEDWFRKQPGILEQALYPVWLIAGLQRTGTTKLQRLLAADPETRSLYSWESMFPAPLADNWAQKDRRIPKTRTAENALRFLAPDFFAIHPVEHLNPEEDVLLLDVSFMSTSWEAMLHVPSYANWLENADQTPAYQYESNLLKLLQWQRPGKRWVLKSPHHLEWLDVVHETYPELLVIWPHRDVGECIPSFMSMVAHGRAMFSNSVDAENVGRHWLRKNRLMLEKALRFREEKPTVPFADLDYRDLVGSPQGQLERIYRKGGVKLSPELVRSFQEADKTSNPFRYGKHHYSVADFGLSLSEIEGETAFYHTFFNQLQSASSNE